GLGAPVHRGRSVGHPDELRGAVNHGVSLTRRSSGHSDGSAPFGSRSGNTIGTEPSCFTNTGVSDSRHSRTIDRIHVTSHGRAPGPDSPPTITQLMRHGVAVSVPHPSNGLKMPRMIDGSDGSSGTRPNSTGPNSGSHDTNLTASGVSSRSGIRSSARCWSSQETPSQTLGRGHWRTCASRLSITRRSSAGLYGLICRIASVMHVHLRPSDGSHSNHARILLARVVST